MAVGNFGSKPLVLVINDELLKDFYANEVSCQETSPMFINLFKKVLGGSLLVSTGDRWKRKRKITSHIFNFNYIKSTYGNYQRIVDKKVTALPEGQSFQLNLLHFLFEANSLNTVEMFFGGGEETSKISLSMVRTSTSLLLKSTTMQESNSEVCWWRSSAQSSRTWDYGSLTGMLTGRSSCTSSAFATLSRRGWRS